MQYKLCKPRHQLPRDKVLQDDVLLGGRSPCSVVHIELITSWPVTALWVLMSCLVSTLATSAFLHPEWFVREFEGSNGVLRYDRRDLASTLGMGSACRTLVDVDATKAASRRVVTGQMAAARTVISQHETDGMLLIYDEEAGRVRGQKAPGIEILMATSDSVVGQQEAKIAALSQKNITGTVSSQTETARTVLSQKQVATEVRAGSPEVSPVDDGISQSAKVELECHNFVADFPSTPWNVAFVLFGSGCLMLCWCSILALCSAMVVGRRSRKTVTELVARLQTVAVLLQLLGLLLYPYALASPLARAHCGAAAAAYFPSGCRLGWAYVAGVASTALACYCPLLARFTHYSVFSACHWTDI